MNILGYLQKVGKALMVPIAVLPAGGLMLGFGYALDPTWGSGGSALASFLIYAGKAIMDNQAWLFAVGVAFGMAKDSNGAAALAGLIGLFIVQTLVSDPAVISMLTGTPVADMSKESVIAYGAVVNAFTGILTGIIAGELYNRFHNIQLPSVLAFFGGRRFVPIITSAVMCVVAYILIVVWPVVYVALVNFGKSFIDLGPVGAGLYGFFNRLLIPLGLHHALNQVFWADLAGINDIFNFWNNTGELGITGRYMAGFFPVMGYGLPAAGLAIYHCAKPENKAKVGSIMLAAGTTAIVTGVTEPLEFAFMFVAPVLFVIHAALTAASMTIAATFQWTAGFTFSGGLIDFLLSMNLPLANKPYMLVVQGLCFAALYYVVFRFAITKFDLKTPGREDESEVSAVAASTDKAKLAAQYTEALGGKSNLESIDACITRLRLAVHDMNKVDEAALKELGAMGVVKLNEHNVQVILGPEAELVAGEMKALPA
ncbi:N-acetylglucosamine-specific PTS transporter subunit IIBC [Vibrio tubiashii]|uniref:N-acetylglucosamine-specific PTS transporter subunit IIBC n=2 Tax=Vibrio tubiashii TaxID=29498 RepID=UPI001EFC5558|nr:N-acetylglucosamine-specific PTS transporter subunit IIBC [Vibrio tubiashii]MCG9614186.1 N-acetylglucosamine-specific PTS transporter subunit IIBC [Vibrio tubiashii]MCG9688029.1 N-acetylglucosamine-specific PTS transporter subunit IIBC [Vibrio tubiashii]